VTDEEERTGSCPTCARRDPHTPLLCDVCRSRLRSWLGDLPALFEELEERTKELAEPLDHRPYVATMVEMAEGSKKRVVRSWQVLTMRAADQVAYLLPAGGTSSPSATGPVSGSKEPRLPIDVDEVDLLGPPRPLMPERAHRGPDEDGHDSIASTLDFWVEDWREARGGREGRPAPHVPALAAWLLRRVDDAMDSHFAIDEFFDQIRQIHGVLRGQLGQFDVPDYKRGIPCPRCSMLTLVHHNGSQYVECGSCPAVLSFSEFEEHVRTSWADHHARRKATMSKAKALRSLLSAMRAAGWIHTVRHEESERDSDGAPWHEGYTVHCWHRDPELIEFWTYSNDTRALDSMWLVRADHDEDPQPLLTVSTAWVEQNGYPGLQKLAKAAGLLGTPSVALAAQVRQEKAA
jgi:hypothetical protein